MPARTGPGPSRSTHRPTGCSRGWFQMGVERGGFYAYDWAEQLFADPMHNTTWIHPECQTLEPGGVVHPSPNQDWPVDTVEPDRALVLGGNGWSWATETASPVAQGAEDIEAFGHVLRARP